MQMYSFGRLERLVSITSEIYYFVYRFQFDEPNFGAGRHCSRRIVISPRQFEQKKTGTTNIIIADGFSFIFLIRVIY